jgi:ribosome-interacting GTPase 1
MARTQKNKNTSFHLGTITPRTKTLETNKKTTGLTIGAGQLKAKLAKLKRELLTPSGGGGGGGGECFPILTLCGFPDNL